jgi:hypothetical protein
MGSAHPTKFAERFPLPRVQRNAIPVRQQIGHGLQERAGWRAVDDSMVEGQTQDHHRPLSNLTAVDHRFLNDTADPEDAGLRRVEDRRKAIDPIHTQVRDREGAAGDLFQSQLARPRFFRQAARLLLCSWLPVPPFKIFFRLLTFKIGL